MSNPQLQKSGLLPDVCHNPALPLDLQPVCASQEAASTFKALSKDINPQISLPPSLHPALPLHQQLFLLSNPSGCGQEAWRVTAPARPRSVPVWAH